MKIGVLTSSRADFGIYSPLLKELERDADFDVEIIAFGTHLSERHGNTITEIKDGEYSTIHEIQTRVEDSSPKEVALAYSDVIAQFASFWGNHSFDLVLCLGDRYEMSAAVQSGIIFNINFAHFYGGDVTIGSIDNIFRHQITLASSYHFTSTETYKQRVIELIDGNSAKAFNVGAITLSGLSSMPTVSRSEFDSLFNIPSKPYILATFHPETSSPEKSAKNIEEMTKSFELIPESHHLIVTMPNADAQSNVIRTALESYQKKEPLRITLVESFGKKYYFTALKHAAFVMGNSSSAIVEAASFGQYVINIGNRQEGRLQSENTFNCKFNSSEIIELITSTVNNKEKYTKENIYIRDNSIELVTDVLRKIANGQL